MLGKRLEAAREKTLEIARNRVVSAPLLGEDGDSEVFSAEHQRLGQLIHERCWSASAQIYFDLAGTKQIERFHVGAYWTLIAGIVPDDCVAGLVSQVFEETGTLWENLAPDARQPGDPAQPDFCGWAGLGSAAIPHEFLGMPMR